MTVPKDSIKKMVGMIHTSVWLDKYNICNKACPDTTFWGSARRNNMVAKSVSVYISQLSHGLRVV